MEAPSLRTLNIALQVRPKHELGDPDTLFGVARNIDIYASRVTSLTALDILVIFDLNFLLQWHKDSFKEQLSDQFLCHAAFEQWRRTSKLFARGVLTIKFAIVRREYLPHTSFHALMWLLYVLVKLDADRDTGYWDVVLWEYRINSDKDPAPSPLRIPTMPAYSYGVDFERLIPKLFQC